jgi:hypothetical protein
MGEWVLRASEALQMTMPRVLTILLILVAELCAQDRRVAPVS